MISNRIVAVEIGNSSTDIGLFENSDLLKSDFFPSAGEYGEKICRFVEQWHMESQLEHVIISSVVPALSDLLQTLIQHRLKIIPLMVEDFKTQLFPLLVDRPETVGVDRIVNCFAAIHLYGCPSIVVSLGTATTFEAISVEGSYLGGSIVPGIKISIEALSQKTALLPPILFNEKPSQLIAKNTIEHMRSGMYYGTIGMIEGMVKRMKAVLGDETKVIGTGGMSKFFADEQIFDHLDPNLTLKGLERIHHFRCRNRF